MAITTKNQDYFDDLNIPDVNGKSPIDKNYLRVLFKPGVNVQTRELNQAQSMLQAQIDRLGSGLFKPNSLVVGGQATLDSAIDCIEFAIGGLITESLLAEFQKDLTLLSITRLSSSGAVSKASVTAIESVTNSTAPGVQGATHRIYYKNTEGAPLKDVLGDTALTLLYGDFITDEYTLTPLVYKKAVGLTADAGIYFVRGCMVATQRQYTARPLEGDSNFNGFVYFLVEENYVDSIDDSTLNDNASDTSNFLESGADRYQIVLTLKLLTASELSLATDAIKLADIRSNEIYIQYNTIDQSGAALENTLARRTYEESGNYTVKAFDLELKELYGTDYNAIYTNTTDLVDFTGIPENQANDYFVAKLSPGIAYVKGKRVQTLAPTNLIIQKAKKTYSDLTFERGQRTKFNAATSALYGNYVTGYTGYYNSNYNQYSGYGYGSGNIDNGSSGLPVFENNNVSYVLYDSRGLDIGTTKISGIEPEGVKDTDQIKAKLYLYDIVLEEGARFNDVAVIASDVTIAGYGKFDFTVEKVNGIALNDINNTDSIFEFPHEAITEVQNLIVSRRLSDTDTLLVDNNVVDFSPSGEGRSYDVSRNNIVVAINGEIITSGYYIIPNGNGIRIVFDTTLSAGTKVSVIVTETGNIDADLGEKLKITESVDLIADEGDIYKLDGVYHAISITDTANWVLVDDGQRDNVYVNARVRKIGGGTATTLEVTHWKFRNSGAKYYTVNSYKIGNTTTSSQAPLNEIPTYGDIVLSDSIDCRSLPNQLRLSLDPYSAITAQIDFYLPRIDLISVNSDNSLRVISGQADLDPKLPNIPDDGMAIYALYVPQFTASASDVEARLIENRRYTMSDIGNIEKRIGAIEYYTSLSLLERDANERSIFGTDGEKFKNGFITDGFRNLDVADTTRPEFLCSVDSQRGILYPYHAGYSIPFNPKTVTVDGVTIKNNKAFLSYDEIDVDYLTQPSASQFIDLQPHEQSADVGIMNLTPEVDTWSNKTEKDVTPIELYAGFDSFLLDFANEAGFTGTQWNSWVTTSQVSKKVKNKKQAKKFLEANGVTGVDVGKFSNKNPALGIGAIGATGILTGGIGVALGALGGLFGGLFGKKKKRITIKRQVASGVQTDIAFDDVEQSLGEYVKDVNISTYMRTRAVLVEVAGVKPNTQFYAFFDDKDVTNFVKPLPDTFVPADYNFTDDEGKSQAQLLEKYTTTSNLVSDADGNIVAMFIIPNDATFKFSTGEKLLRLTNSPRNVKDEEDSFAEARFISNGLDIDIGENVISTQVPRVTRQIVSRNRVCVRKNDPIAQTFRVEDDSGIFASSIELAFAQKPPAGSAPVQVYLVTVANGYPTDTIVPGSETSLTNSQIQVSDDSLTMTRFEFANPIYLEPNTEYAIVAFSGSFGYKAYISDLGAADIANNGAIISKQPAAGVFFTSANKTAWTASQNRDLKFKIRRANFNSLSGKLESNPIVGSGLHRVDISSFDPAGDFENNGWSTTGVTVTVDAAPTGRTAAVTPIFSPIDTSIVGFNITEPGTGYTSDPEITVTSGGRTATFQGKRPQYRIGAFNLNQKFIELSGKTQISNILELDTGANARTYSVESGEPIENVVNSNFAIGTDSVNEVRLTSRLISTDSRLSPVIDLESLSLETREYAVKESGATSRYFSKPVYLAEPADQLDVIVDINLPTKSSNIKVFGQFFDQNNNPISNKYFTRKSPNSGLRYANVVPGWRLRRVATVNNVTTYTVDAIITDVQQVEGIWRYYYNETTPISTTNIYDLVPPSGTTNAIEIGSNNLALSVPTESDWIELKPTSPTVIPVNSDRAKYSEVKFNINFPEDVDFKQFAVKVEFRGSDYIDVPTIRNFRAIASL